MIRLELIIVNLLPFTNMAAPLGLVKTVIPISLKPKRIRALEYTFSKKDTILRLHAKNQQIDEVPCLAEVRILQKITPKANINTNIFCSEIAC